MTAPTDDRSGRAAATTGAAGFSPADRIRRRSDYLRVYESGRKIHGRFMTLFILPRLSEPSRLGIAATRKLGRAVSRNLAKRRVREIFRAHRPPSPADIVIVPKREFFDASFESLTHEFVKGVMRGLRPATEPPHGPA
jgi:ribonuclease P protein component